MKAVNTKVDFRPLKKSEEGNLYEIKVQIPMHIGWIEDVKLILEFDNNQREINMTYFDKDDTNAYFKTETFIETKAIYHYYFTFKANGQYMSLKNNEKFKLSVNFDVPDWAKGKVMYHIFLDRFNRGSQTKLKPMPKRHIHTSWNEEMQIGPDNEGIWNNDFYGGDLKGIENKLDYLKELGVDIIYISPVVKSQSNHRYDTADYEMVDPYAGTNEDLKNLCDKAHELDIKVILDAVFNHTGNDSKYFNEFGTYSNLGAYQSKDSIYSNFYRKHEENGQIKYEYWWGMKNLPECDGYSKEWIDYITGENGIIDKWFDLGIDGLRLDVADELNDEFIKKIRIAVKRNKQDGFILGEVWKNPMRMNRGYISSGKAMDSVMDYLLIDALLRYFKYSDKDKLNQILNEILIEYPDDTIKTLMNFTSTHDITRAINLMATDEFQKHGEWAWNLNNDNYDWCKNYHLSKEDYNNGKKRLAPYIFTLTFFPGILSIFYGDEIGMQGMGNLSNRKPYPKENHDKEVFAIFKTAGNIRKIETFLRDADIKIKEINDNYFSFERYDKNNKMLITVSRIGYDQDINTPEEYQTPSKVYTLNNSKINHLTPYGAIAIKK